MPSINDKIADAIRVGTDHMPETPENLSIKRSIAEHIIHALGLEGAQAQRFRVRADSDH